MKHVLFVELSVYKGWSPLSPGATIAKRLCTMNVCTFDACSNLSILYESGPLWRSLFANLYNRSRFAFGFPLTKCAENMPHMMMMVFYILCILREHHVKWRCIYVCSPSFFLFLSTTLKDNISTSLSAFEDDSLLHFTKEGFSSS